MNSGFSILRSRRVVVLERRYCLLPVKMGKNYCAVKDCHNVPGKIGRFGKPVKLHELPKKKNLRTAWLMAISRKNFNPKRTQVCSDHFPDGNGRTWSNQVPTLYLPQKSPKLIKKRESKNSNKPFSTLIQEHEQQSFKVNLHNYSKPVVAASSNSEATREDFDENLRISGSPGNEHVPSPSFVDAFTDIERPDITIEDIKDSCDKILFYTGLPDYATYNALFECLIQQGANKLVLDTPMSETPTKKGGAKRKLRIEDEFLMVMMRLRLGLLLKDLEYRFKITSGRISRIFKAWLKLMCKCLQTIVFLPPLKDMNCSPKCFEKFKDTRIILDCTEIFVQTPSSLQTQSQTYSNYKGHNTLKALIGIDKVGAVVLISHLWGGSVSDTQITRKSGLYDMLEEGDAVMVDKGFINIKEDLSQRGVKLYCPPFLINKQFTKKEVETTRRIASARIHVERKMEQIKNFRVLQGVIPISLCDIVDEVFFVCAALTNLLPALVK